MTKRKKTTKIGSHDESDDADDKIDDFDKNDDDDDRHDKQRSMKMTENYYHDDKW